MRRNLLIFQRLNDHIAYLKCVEATLAGKQAFVASAPQDCAFGRWLQGEGRRQTGALGPEAQRLFEALLEPHAQFHRWSERAVAARSGGDAIGAARAGAEMRRLSKTILDLLVRLDHIAHGMPEP